MPSRKNTSINENYLETLQMCTKTVMDLYKKHSQSFPKEYAALVSHSKPNGTILHIPTKKSGNNLKIKYMRYKRNEFEPTEKGLLDLVNSWVYLEKHQTPLHYLGNYFKFIISILGISKYRLKQMYLDLELDEEDDYIADPDYNPDNDTEDYYEELEHTSYSDVDPDYVPSAESEDEYETTQRSYTVIKNRKSKY